MAMRKFPLLACSLVMLAGAVVSFEHDVTWIATAAVGTLAGWLRGRRIAVQTDQVWGTIRTPVAYDGVVAGFCLFAITFADSLSGLLPPGTLVPSLTRDTSAETATRDDDEHEEGDE